MALTIIAAILGLWLRRRRVRKQQSIKVLSLRHLQRVRNAFEQHGDSQRLAKELSMLLRRASISAYNREETAGITGDAWLKFLDQNLSGQRFTEGPGKLLIDTPYQRRPHVDASELLSVCEDWIRSLPEQPAGDRP